MLIIVSNLINFTYINSVLDYKEELLKLKQIDDCPYELTTENKTNLSKFMTEDQITHIEEFFTAINVYGIPNTYIFLFLI
jgi:hypothetical protein